MNKKYTPLDFEYYGCIYVNEDEIMEMLDIIVRYLWIDEVKIKFVGYDVWELSRID